MNSLDQFAALLQQRNQIDSQIGRIIGRPASTGHIGEWIAAQIFDIELATSASNKGYDGTFRSGPLEGQTVNVKMYGTHQGMLDISDHHADYYLVLASPLSAATSSRGELRPFSIASVYLFDTPTLITTLTDTEKIGAATNVRRDLWNAAQIFPTTTNPLLEVSEEQRTQLALFTPQSPTPPMTV